MPTHSRPSDKAYDAYSCFGDCDETICSACYYSNDTLPIPTLKMGCPTVCPVDANGEIFGKTCLKKWGRCVRSANLSTYGKVGKIYTWQSELKLCVFKR